MNHGMHGTDGKGSFRVFPFLPWLLKRRTTEYTELTEKGFFRVFPCSFWRVSGIV